MEETTIKRNMWLYLPANMVFEDWFAAKKILGTNRSRRLKKEGKLIIYNNE